MICIIFFLVFCCLPFLFHFTLSLDVPTQELTQLYCFTFCHFCQQRTISPCISSNNMSTYFCISDSKIEDNSKISYITMQLFMSHNSKMWFDSRPMFQSHIDGKITQGFDLCYRLVLVSFMYNQVLCWWIWWKEQL